MSELLDPLNYTFIRDALQVGVIIAVMCAILSCFLILKRWSLMGDAISHAVLPGVVIAYLLSIPLVIGAFISGLVCACGTLFIKENSRIKEDTVMGVVFSGMFAFGLVLFSRTSSDIHLDHILIGNILGISAQQILQTNLISGFVILVAILFRRDLLLMSFDRVQARVIDLPDGFLNYALLGLLSLGVVAAIQSVGIILVVAMLIAPGCIGHLLTDRFDRMLIIAVLSAVIATVAGILISYHFDASSAASIVLVQSALFFLAFIFAPKYGLIKQVVLR